MIHIVTLERRPMRAAPEFISAIERESDYYKNIMTGVWVVDTRHPADPFATYLRQFIKDTDSLFVARLSGDSGGWLTQQKWDWLAAATRNFRYLD